MRGKEMSNEEDKQPKDAEITGTDDPEGDTYFSSQRTLGEALGALSWPGIDPDFDSSSKYGANFVLEEPWDLTKQYILKGDETYQYVGLSMLKSLVWNLPLGEAADVLEQYFSAWHYMMPAGGRGGVNLNAVQAAYAVGTTFGRDGSDLPERQERMAKLLERYKFRLMQVTSDYAMEGDAEIVQEAIDAIRSNRPDYTAAFSAHAELDSTSSSATATKPEHEPDYVSLETEIRVDSNVTAELTVAPLVPSNLTVAEVNTIVNEKLEQFRQDSGFELSQPELMSVKHGYELLDRDIKAQSQLFTEKMAGLGEKVTSLDEKLGDRINSVNSNLGTRMDNVEKQITLVLGSRQLSEGKTQNKLAGSALAAAIVVGAFAFYAYFFPRQVEFTTPIISATATTISATVTPTVVVLPTHTAGAIVP